MLGGSEDDNDIFSNSESLEDTSSFKKKKIFAYELFWFLKYSKKTFPSILTLCVSLIVFTLGASFLWIDKTLSSVNYVKEDVNANTDVDFKGLGENKLGFLRDSQVLNILIFGIDGHKENERGRSDSIILMSVDSRHKKLKLTSFMRDLLVEIPGHSHDKLNHAFFYGGASLAVSTIEKNFKIAIDRYLFVDFESFRDIIDVLGGIDMNLTAGEAAYINRWSRDDRMIEVSNGTKHLLAPHALCHARNRSSAGSDFDRIKRQRDVMRACFKKIKSANMMAAADIISRIGPKITTNFHKNEIMRLSPNIFEFLGYELDEYSVPEPNDCFDSFRKGMSVLKVKTMKESCYKLAKFIYEDVELIGND